MKLNENKINIQNNVISYWIEYYQTKQVIITHHSIQVIIQYLKMNNFDVTQKEQCSQPNQMIKIKREIDMFQK